MARCRRNGWRDAGRSSQETSHGIGEQDRTDERRAATAVLTAVWAPAAPSAPSASPWLPDCKPMSHLGQGSTPTSTSPRGDPRSRRPARHRSTGARRTRRSPTLRTGPTSSAEGPVVDGAPVVTRRTAPWTGVRRRSPRMPEQDQKLKGSRGLVPLKTSVQSSDMSPSVSARSGLVWRRTISCQSSRPSPSVSAKAGLVP